jgi:hypothetical protein
MSSPRFALLLAACLWLTGSVIAAQAASPQNGAPVDNDFVQKQFGSNCSLIGLAPIIADLDGDGVADIVIPARCTNPMMDQSENNYVVVDPYNSFFGYGNPAITTQFASEDPKRRGYSLLVIHGLGSDAWRSATPKAKFLIVNLPFNKIYVKKLVVKKKDHMAIYVEETGGDAMSSVLAWDGKKYRYQPMGSNLE